MCLSPNQAAHSRVWTLVLLSCCSSRVAAITDSCAAVADAYAASNEDNYFGRVWSNHTSRVSLRAAGDPAVQLVSSVPLISVWDGFFTQAWIERALEWHRRSQVEYEARKGHPSWCFWEDAQPWLEELRQSRPELGAPGESRCPVHTSGDSSIDLPFSTTVTHQGHLEDIEMDALEQHALSRLGWDASMVQFVGASSVIEYRSGAAYKRHHDCMRHLNRQNDRMFSLIIYLNTIESGGRTVFPQVGVSVAPVAGRATLWRNLRGERPGECDLLTEHAAEAPEGTRMVMQMWFHLRPYRTGQSVDSSYGGAHVIQCALALREVLSAVLLLCHKMWARCV
jgi:hypothetical protein